MEIMRLIREGREEDLPEIAAIHNASPDAAHWSPADYLQYRLQVCVEKDRVAGFVAWREATGGEFELLNVAVAPEFRRRGVARQLIESMIERFKTGGPCSVFLEVRESNSAARALYKSLKFEDLGTRPNYYEYPLESAIVMKFQSC